MPCARANLRHLKRTLAQKRGNSSTLLQGLRRPGPPTLNMVPEGSAFGAYHGANTSTETRCGGYQPLYVFFSAKRSPGLISNPQPSLFDTPSTGAWSPKIGARDMFGTELKPWLLLPGDKIRDRGFDCESMCAPDSAQHDAGLKARREPALENGYKGNGFTLVLGPSFVRSISLRP